jgi:hypothetical protein
VFVEQDDALHLVNTASAKQYEGLRHTVDL